MMAFLKVLFMAFMVFAMFSIDYHLCKIREKLEDIKILTELKKKYEENENEKIQETIRNG